MTQNSHIISQAYKNVYRAASKTKGGTDLTQFSKGKYEIYKILSKYFFCNILVGISRQYAKLVAEQTLKETNKKYAEQSILDEFNKYVTYDINTDVKALLE